MARHPSYSNVFARRLKEARRAKGMTQEALGREAGLDESVASPRVNQYEQAKHWPDYGFAILLAEKLDVPVAYFYALDDDEAEILLAFHRGNKAVRNRMLAISKDK